MVAADREFTPVEEAELAVLDARLAALDAKRTPSQRAWKRARDTAYWFGCGFL